MQQLELNFKPDKKPWMDYSKPFWWRRNKLEAKADKVAEQVIDRRNFDVYRKSIQESRKIKDGFYKRHLPEVFEPVMREKVFK